MKLQFIITGWHYNKEQYYIDLDELQSKNENINVFWSCHKTPTPFITNNFDHVVFPNIGLEWGCYQQAIDYLKPDNDTIIFFMHDDLLIKDWSFITECIYLLNSGFKVIGNGINYPLVLNPNKIVYKEKRFIDFVKESSKKYFDTELFTYTLRGSFFCITSQTLAEVDGFEVIWEEPEKGKGKGIGGVGNIQQQLFGYKLTKQFGINRFKYLSDLYQESKYIFECARGE